MEQTNYADLRKSRGLVIIEAALEYFVHLCVTATMLTAIMTEMELNSALQGVINAIASLACSIQLLAVFTVKKTYPCKRWVSILNLLNQLLFALLYCVPMINVSQKVKVVAFIGLLLLAYACQHYLTPSRVNWQMSLVEDNKRGIFTANKEIISLFGGMFFSQASGILVDHFKAKGDMRTCFIIFGITITVLSVLHLITMIGTKEPMPQNPAPPKDFKEILRTVFLDRNLRRVTIFDTLFVISTVSLHFSSIYLVKTFGMSYTYITFIGVIHSLFRALVSRSLGRLADKKSWAYMLRVCMSVLAAGFVVFTFCIPSTVKYLYPIFSLCYAFSLGGSNAGRTNLCLDYAKQEDRRYILGIQHSISGVVGFFVTLMASALVGVIERNGNKVFGLHIYPQQILFATSAILLLFLAFWFLPRMKRPNRVSEDIYEK